MTLSHSFRALDNDRRRLILEWLRDPRAHFAEQLDGDLVRDGVCGLRIAQKLKVSQPTASEHLRVLVQGGFLRGKRIRQWVFYKRDENRIREIKRAIMKAV